MTARRLLALVACSATKGPRPVPAGELYTSALFRKSRAWAERFADSWRILSAAHGLVDPETELAPYDVNLATLSPARRERWARETAVELLYDLARDGRPTVVVFLAGRLYRTELGRALTENARHPGGRNLIGRVELFAGTRGIGDILGLLTAHLDGREDPFAHTIHGGGFLRLK